MNYEVRAISFSEKDCGKHLSEEDNCYNLVRKNDLYGTLKSMESITHFNLEIPRCQEKEQSCSTWSKFIIKKSNLNFYKSLLNIDFDFTHMIQGHSFRISRIEDSINKYELRIDNRTFDEVRLGKGKTNISSSTIDYAKKSNDPFADFETFASNKEPSKETSKNNAFGDFDFDSFSRPSVSSVQNKVEQKPTNNTANNSSLLDFGFGETPKTQSIPVNEFQTNAFQTKSPNGFDDFLQSFKQNESNLLDDEDQFATNAYVNRNHYLDLQGNKQQSDRYFGEGMTPPQPEEHKDKTIKENFMEYNKIAGQTVKKAANQIAMKFNEVKKTINESLI